MSEAIGVKSKDGVIIKSIDGFDYYFGLSDKSLKPVMKAPMGPSVDKVRKVKTLKVFNMVSIANNKFTVNIWPGGKVEVIPNNAE